MGVLAQHVIEDRLRFFQFAERDIGTGEIMDDGPIDRLKDPHPLVTAHRIGMFVHARVSPSDLVHDDRVKLPVFLQAPGRIEGLVVSPAAQQPLNEQQPRGRMPGVDGCRLLSGVKGLVVFPQGHTGATQHDPSVDIGRMFRDEAYGQ